MRRWFHPRLKCWLCHDVVSLTDILVAGRFYTDTNRYFCPGCRKGEDQLSYAMRLYGIKP